jgi:hypothetical protein
MKPRIAAPRRLSLVLCVLLALVPLSACRQQAKPIDAESDGKPTSIISGYYAPGQSLRGGADISRLNLRDIEVVRDGEDLLVILTFMEGSAQMGMEEKPAPGVPLYQTRYLPGVDRLVLEITGLAFWDYRVYENEINNTLIQGIFKQTPVGTEITRIYFNTRDQFAYRIQSVNHQLFIRLRPLSEEETVGWYVTVDGFQEYAEGRLPADFDMAPSLCDDLSNKMLISRPFATEEEAQAFVEENQTIFETRLPGKTPALVQLRSNQLPAFDESTELSALANTPIGRADGQERTFPSFIENGRFLCWHPDGATYAFIRPFFLSSNQQDEVYYNEQIWTGSTSGGTPMPLVDYDFTSITAAAYSADGRYLAFIEQTDSARMLEIIDTQTGRVSIAAEEDFGEDTADFVWDERMPRLYAIAGGAEGMQIMCYDLSAGENAATVYAMEEEAFTEGEIGMGGDRLFFTQMNPDTVGGSIFSYDINTGERAQIAAGFSLAVSPDGQRMAVTGIVTDEETGAQGYCLQVVEADGTAQTIAENQGVVVDCAWSLNGWRLYYTLHHDASQLEEAYPLGLYCYDIATGQSRYLMDAVTGALYPDSAEDSVLMMVLYNQMGRSIPITYRVALPAG